MLGAIIDALKAIIGLREQAREDARRDLEITKLKAELHDKETAKLIKPATLEDVRQFDPKVQKIESQIRRENDRSKDSEVRLPMFLPTRGLAIVLIFIAIIVFILGSWLKWW